jgi:hypothetical protein
MKQERVIKMEKEFTPYDRALKLKELGFDESCFGYYNMVNHSGKFQFDTRIWENSDDYIEAPLFQQAFRWFREEYDLRIWIESNHGVLKFEYVIATTNHNFIDKQFNDFSSYKTYEEAELACLDKLIEIVESKNK